MHSFPVSPTDPAVSWDLQNVSLHELNIQSFCLEYDAKVLSHPSIIYILLSSSAGFLKVFQCSSLDISCFFIYFQSSLCIGPCFKKQTNKNISTAFFSLFVNPLNTALQYESLKYKNLKKSVKDQLLFSLKIANSKQISHMWD